MRLFLSHLAGRLSWINFFTLVLHAQGVELDDFVSGPRELLLKLVEEHYPLPEEPRYKQYGIMCAINCCRAGLVDWSG